MKGDPLYDLLEELDAAIHVATMAEIDDRVDTLVSALERCRAFSGSALALAKLKQIGMGMRRSPRHE